MLDLVGGVLRFWKILRVGSSAKRWNSLPIEARAGAPVPFQRMFVDFCKIEISFEATTMNEDRFGHSVAL